MSHGEKKEKTLVFLSPRFCEFADFWYILKYLKYKKI